MGLEWNSVRHSDKWTSVNWKKGVKILAVVYEKAMG